MIIASYILFAMLVLRFLVALVNYLSSPFLPNTQQLSDFPKVSILIPARNEEANLPILLADLKLLDYPNYEVIVCNDHSTDHTEQVLGDISTQFLQLSYFTNDPLPKGWVGKNFACDSLAQRATGKYLLFIDADVKVKPFLLTKAVGYVQQKKVKLLSMFPEQIIGSQGEWKTVPIMNWILLTFLPLPLVGLKWFSSLSAANGQFMFFDSENYKQNQWHRQVQDRNVEDILIAKKMKKKRYAIAVLLGNNDISCRMYSSYHAAINGFSLNIHQFFGGSRLWLALFFVIVWVRLPFFLLNGQYLFFALSLLLLLSMLVMISQLSCLKTLRNLRFYPLQVLAFTRIVFLNFRSRFSGSYEWKGRVYRN